MLEKIYRPVLLVLLTILVIVQVVGLVNDISRANACKKATDAIFEQIVSMPSDYKTDVYDNPLVDNINKQQLLAIEYQFYTQQAIALLLMDCH